MGPQVEVVLRAALADLAQNDDALLNGLRWVNECYEDLCSRRLKQRRRIGEVIVPAVMSTGLATVTQRQTAIPLDIDAQTAFADIGLNPAGRYFQAGSNPGWYRIADYNTTSGFLTLDTPYTEPSGVLPYRIVTRYVTLAPGSQFLGAFAFPRRQDALEIYSPAELDLRLPGRPYRLGGPIVVVDCGEAVQGERRVELYPYSTQDELIAYTYWEKPMSLGLQDFLPEAINAEALKKGVLVGVMRYKMAMAASVGKIEEAALWRNEYRAQDTVWQREIQKLVKLDQGVEDITLLLTSRFTNLFGRRDIRTARDEVFARY